MQDSRVSDLLQRVENAVTQRRLLARGQKVLVAVSGGVDSMVLLHSLHLLAKKNSWEISVAHYNHRLRGRASEADEKLVEQTAAGLRLRFFFGGSDVKKIAARSKISIEMASRKLRHEFLARTARGGSIPTIAVAHHADDQVELFFVRLLRGAGGEGLAGMKWRAPSPVDKTISLIRPLLNFSKAELLAFAREIKIQYRNDATNFSADFLRSRIQEPNCCRCSMRITSRAAGPHRAAPDGHRGRGSGICQRCVQKILRRAKWRGAAGKRRGTTVASGRRVQVR